MVSELSSLFVVGVWGLFFLIVMFNLVQSLRIVPQKYTMLVERLGRYHVTLNSGFHILLPFIDKVTYTIDLKEEAIDVPPQECFTKDEVKVNVDGIIYISVVDAVKASYGVTNYKWAAMQLAQTTTRSIIGRMNLDTTFEERATISASVVDVLAQTSVQWGIRVHRYEIKNIKPPESVKNAMEKQVRADRERRAILAKSEGDKQSRISRSEGYKMELINTSEGEKQKLINEAEGKAAEVRAIADATAESIRKNAAAIVTPGGPEAIALQLSEQFLSKVGLLAQEHTQVVLPLDLANCRDVLASLGVNSALAVTHPANKGQRLS